MKVLHTIETPGPGGAERILVDVATGIRPECESVGLMLCDSWTGKELQSRGINSTVLPLTRNFDWMWPRRFARYLREERVDVVHGHEFTATCYAAIGAKLARVPMICTIHGKNYWPNKHYRRAALGWVVRNVGAFVAVSNDLRSFVAETLSVDLSRIAMVPNGINVSRFREDADLRRLTRDSLGLSDNEQMLLTVGELSDVKGHVNLVGALPAILRMNPAARLILAGDGPERASLEAVAAGEGVAHRVTFLGFRRDVPALLNAADLFVLPSLSEGMPLVVLEAMAVGVPVLASHVGGVPELIAQGVTGWMVPARDPAALANAVNTIFADPSERRRCARKAQEIALERFADHQMIRSYINLYAAAVESGNA